MILKALTIIRKLIILFFYNLNNQPHKFIIDLYQKYKNEGRKSCTKSINISYNILMMTNNSLSYTRWIKENEVNLTKIDINLIPYQPLISIVLPTYNTPSNFLKKAIQSIISQSYTNWELCIADDASTVKSTLELLVEYEQNYSNIKVCYRKENGHISASSNSGLSLAEGEYIAFMDHDDELSINALYEVVKVINEQHNATIIYSDEDKIDFRSKRFEPHFKPDWNEDMFYSQNYISHFTVIKKDVLNRTDKFRLGYEGAQDYDLILQCLCFIDRNTIYHISKILYHWRAIPGSTAQESAAKSYADKAGLKALKRHFYNDCNVSIYLGEVSGTYRVKYAINKNLSVSIIMPSKDNYSLLYKAITSIETKTSYKNYEIIIVDNQTTEPQALEYLKLLNLKDNIKVIHYDKVFNYAAINNFAVKEAKGEFLLFINNDIEVLNSLWLDEMLSHANRRGIGIVGAKLYYSDMTIQHAGVILGIGGVAGHAHKYFTKEDYGYMSRLKIVQNYSAVTAACMLMKKDIFNEVFGFEEELQVAFNDIDLCLKVLEKGYRNLWTPYAELIHYESKSRGREDNPEKISRFNQEIKYMKERWERELLDDKCYNKNLTLKYENFSLK
ncbi:MAG TPA: glycosyltransferase family 2 protein [Crocinitomix sp.]|nr:glycosyltransferase family 2 protein [Crocinitomix sp.]